MTATSPGAITLGARTNPGKPALRHICAIRADLGAALEFETAQGTVRAMFPILGGRVLGDGGGRQADDGGGQGGGDPGALGNGCHGHSFRVVDEADHRAGGVVSL